METPAGRTTLRTVVTEEGILFIMPSGPHYLELHARERLLVVNDEYVHLTPLEYRTLERLVQNYGIPVSFDDLTDAAFSSPATIENRSSLRRHIDRIRLKLRACHLTNIACQRLGVCTAPYTGTLRGQRRYCLVTRHARPLVVQRRRAP